jgi:hypothetical protein
MSQSNAFTRENYNVRLTRCRRRIQDEIPWLSVQSTGGELQRFFNALGYQLWREDVGEDDASIRLGLRRAFPQQAPPPTPGPTPGPLVPIVDSGLVGNFLYPFANFFFGPACAAFDSARRREYFEHEQAIGHNAVMINALQDNWGPPRGHPEWTSGGFDASSSSAQLQHLVNVLIEARSYGLIPVVGLVDQQQLIHWSRDLVIAWSRDLVAATHDHCAGYMAGWEGDEVLGSSDDRVAYYHAWFAGVDWRGRFFGIHYADGLKDSVALYQPMGRGSVRMMQYGGADDDAALIDKSRKIAVTAQITGSRVCGFEHSSPNNPPTYSEADCIRRAGLVMRTLHTELPDSQIVGSLNG